MYGNKCMHIYSFLNMKGPYVRDCGVALCLLLLVCNGCRGDYLVFGGVDGAGTPGLWGGEVDRHDPTPHKADLYTAGYSCALWDHLGVTEYLKETKVISASYNKWTTDFLLQLYPSTNDGTSPWQRVTLAAGPLCIGNVSCSMPVPLILWDVVSSKGDPGPFAWYNQQLYFILTRREEVKAFSSEQTTFDGDLWRENNTSVNRTWIELRRSETCQQTFPFRKGNFDLVHCSNLVATVFDSEIFSNGILLSDDEEMVPGRHLLLVPTSIGQFAFIVLFKVPKLAGASEPEAMLVEVAMETSEKPPKVTYHDRSTMSLQTSLTSSSLRQVWGAGGVDTLENQVCWSSLDRVRCAWWDPESFRDLVIVGEAAEVKPHCTKGDDGEGALLVGVAIATTDHPFRPGNLSLYVTCQSSQNNTVGGALVYHVNSGLQSVNAVTSQYGPINARSIFLSAGAKEACPTIAPPTGGGSGGGAGGSGGGAGGGSNGRGAINTPSIITTLLSTLLIPYVVIFSLGRDFIGF